MKRETIRQQLTRWCKGLGLKLRSGRGWVSIYREPEGWQDNFDSFQQAYDAAVRWNRAHQDGEPWPWEGNRARVLGVNPRARRSARVPVGEVELDGYGPRKGLEGPFRYRSGIILYYDPREGAYYDPRADMYLSLDEVQAHQEPRGANPGEPVLSLADRQTVQRIVDWMDAEPIKPLSTSAGLSIGGVLITREGFVQVGGGRVIAYIPPSSTLRAAGVRGA